MVLRVQQVTAELVGGGSRAVRGAMGCPSAEPCGGREATPVGQVLHFEVIRVTQAGDPSLKNSTDKNDFFLKARSQKFYHLLSLLNRNRI